MTFMWKPTEESLGEFLRKHKMALTEFIKQQWDRCRRSFWAVGILGVFCILVLLQMVGICRNGYVYMAGDMTLEMVQSFLEHDSLYQIHPLTGQAYEAGVPMRIQILCLPTLYAALCSLFGLAPQLLVWTLMPVYFLICSYLVYYLLARRLFGERMLHVGCFMVLVGLIIGWGTYAYGMDGLGLIYRGFRGESIRAGILLPYVIGQVLEHKWWSVLLCVGTELFIVWTLYGMGTCAFVAIGFLVIALIKGDFSDKSGKEASVCGK